MWITTLGGPFLILPASAVAAWPGAGDSESGELGPEYARICDTDTAFAVVTFAETPGIVVPSLWDDQAPTTLIAQGRREAYVVRAMFGARAELDDDLFVRELRNEMGTTGEPMRVPASLRFGGGGLLLFDGVWSGREVLSNESAPETDSVEIGLEPGEYVLMSADVVIRGSEYWCLRLTKRADAV